jgi:hypothetical protein
LPDFTTHDVEALARKLYEASDLEGLPLADRRLVMRDPWLVAARKRLIPTLGAANPASSGLNITHISLPQGSERGAGLSNPW